MHGEYTIQVKSKFITYELKIDRRLLIVRGDSATGKTELCRMLEAYNAFGTRSGVTVSAAVPVRVIPNNITYVDTLLNSHNTVYVADESVPWRRTKEFMKLVTQSDNYFILISRGDEKHLNYDVSAVLKIHASDKFNSLTQYFKPSQINVPITTIFNASRSIITEDSGSGLQL